MPINRHEDLCYMKPISGRHISVCLMTLHRSACCCQYPIESFNLCKIWLFIIHPCDPTVVICYLIWPCDIAVRITYLISHSSSLSCDTVIEGYFRLGV